MILTIDFGNTNVVLGGFGAGEEPEFVLRLPSTRGCPQAQWDQAVGECLARAGSPRITRAALTSVVPALTGPLADAVEGATGVRPLVIGPDYPTGLVIHGYDAPRLGSDRVVDAVAALASYPTPLAIFDLGTATTLSVLDREGRFVGGMILAGVELCTQALSSRAAQLPPVTLEPPGPPIGRDTVACIRNGALYGAAAQIDGLAAQVEAELGERVTTVVTGGWGSLAVPLCRRDVVYDPHLILKGLRLLCQRERE